MLLGMKTLLVVGLLAGAAWAQADAQVHVIEERVAKEGRFEVALFPAAVQLNGQFTQHVGTFGAVIWHVRERFALQILGGGNWHNVESSFNAELVDKFRVEAQASASLLWTWGVFGGVEVEPLAAKFTLFNGPLAHFGLVLSGGAGAGGTRHQLKPETDSPASYGDTGPRFMGTFAAGFRLSLGKHFTLRMEVRDVAYSARIQSINGCTLEDAQAIDGQTRGLPNQPVAAACRGFGTGREGVRDVPLAVNLMKDPNSSVLHNVGAYLGAGFVF
jgi:outer membrane beta-barrel protein